MLVGGLGAQAHGATRPTKDWDSLPRFDDENLERLCSAMRELGARIRAEGFPDEQAKAVAAEMLHPATFRSALITNWMTDAGPLDVLQDMPGQDGRRTDYGELAGRSTERTLSGIRVQVASLEDIVESKRQANRPKDQDALPELERLLAQKQASRDESHHQRITTKRPEDQRDYGADLDP